MTNRIILIGTLALAGCAGATLGGVDLSSVARVGSAALPIGTEAERSIGRGIAATVAGHYTVLEDPALTRYLNLVGQAVAQQSTRRSEIPFHFGVLDSEEVNAFAAPGGYVLVTLGGLRLMESEAELAGVLAHEIAHVDEKQVLQEIRRSDVLRSVQDEAQLSGELLEQIAGLGTGVLFTGLQRSDEMAADSIAILYASGAGYRADGLLRFLRRLDSLEGDAGGRLARLRQTHPSPADRLAALERQLQRSGLDGSAGAELADRFRARVPR
jgi:beta-barrel assembly-enhancing protease